jgi:predicted ATPase
VLVTGEPGIGKTRLAEEFCEIAARCETAALWGRCWEGGGAPAYWPWREVLHACFRDRDLRQLRSLKGDAATYLTQLLPELLEMVPESTSLDMDQARFRLFDVVKGVLTEVSESAPLVLVLDDLHAADPPALLLLQFLAARIRNARLLIIGTYRGAEARLAPAARILDRAIRSFSSCSRMLCRRSVNATASCGPLH